MKSRLKRRAEKQKEHPIEDVDDDVAASSSESEKEEEDEQKQNNKKNKNKKDESPNLVKPEKKAAGWNFCAIAFLFLFISIPCATGVIYLMDIIYPDYAKANAITSKVNRCYASADMSKLDQVPKFVEKYKGNEHRLFAILTDKYGDKHHECVFRF